MRAGVYISIVIIGFFFASCASKVRPSGGEKDINPPVALQYIPDLYSTNFNKKEVIIDFDEFIQLVDAQSQVIISPIIDPSPTYIVKKKSLVISIEGELKPNTTYNINFGESIVDLHESNPIQNFQYVFSTGNIIDSLKLSGIAIKAKDNSQMKNAVVMLQANLSDTAFQTITPNYITKTNDQGRFEIQNISPGNYNLFALFEDNNNYLFDRPDEFIAFQKTTISIPDSAAYTMRMFQNKPIKHQLFENKPQGLGKHRFIFNLPVEPIGINITCVEKSIDFRKDFNPSNDTLTLWWKDFEIEKMNLAVMYNGESLDTIKVSNAKTVKLRGGSRERTVPRLSIKSVLFSNAYLQRNTRLTLVSNNPITRFNPDSIIILADSVPIISLILNTDGDFRVLTDHVFKDDIVYRLSILPGAFTDYFGNTNDTIQQNFSLRPEREYGSMQLNLSGIDPIKENLLLQMIIGEKKVYRQLQIKQAQTEILFIEPDSYTLRLINDKNNNKKWDTGEYGYKLQPEQVLNYDSKINIRANWFLTVDWNVK